MSTDENLTRERFAKWQGKTHDLLSNFINLLIGLLIGSVAFLSNKLADKDFSFPNIWPKLSFVFACLLLLISGILGIILAHNRLNDFRKTTQRIKSELNNDFDKSQKLSEETKILGQNTWRLFSWHTYTFISGEIFLVLYFITTYYKKIF